MSASVCVRLSLVSPPVEMEDRNSGSRCGHFDVATMRIAPKCQDNSLARHSNEFCHPAADDST